MQISSKNSESLKKVALLGALQFASKLYLECIKWKTYWHLTNLLAQGPLTNLFLELLNQG